MTRPTLTIDLLAIVENYRRLIAQVKSSEVAAVVKADGYGLGAKPIAQALAAAGCKTFFVAHVEEGAELRPALANEKIYVLHGYTALFAKIDTANKPAFAAPASPIAKVATGMPLGICTIDSNES